MQANKYRQQKYRFVIVALFCLATMVNGMCWVVISPISVSISKAYNVQDAVVSIVPMSYMVAYVFINFPSNWVLDGKGIKKGIIAGCALTALGTGIRCLVSISFYFVIVGQIICAIAQPFLTNAPTKIATRWFQPKNRSLALAILSVANIIGTAVGFLIPSLFVEGSDQVSESMEGRVKNQFWTLLLFQFCLAAVTMALNALFFKERPRILPSLGAMVQTIEFTKAIKTLFTNRSFIGLLFAFGTVNGAFNIYGSLLDNILDPYKFQPSDVSMFAGAMMAVGILTACIVGFYVQKSHNYQLFFKIFGLLGIIDLAGLSLALMYASQYFWVFFLVISIQGIVFIPLQPLSFDYGCDTMFPIGEAQITGALMTGGQIIGVIYILVSQQIIGLGKAEGDLQKASLYTTFMVGSVGIVGCILFFMFNGRLKRYQFQSGKNNYGPESILTQT